MKINAMNLRNYAKPENRCTAALPEIKVLRPDGSWKPLAACVALPGQFERALPRKAIEHFVDRARQSNIALERVIAAIRNSWNR
jgi:hypothetical protein